MKHKLILLSVLVLSVNVSGQFHYLGMQGGLNISNISDDGFVENSKCRNGIAAGLNYEFQFPGNLLVGVDLLYVQKGYLSDFIFSDELGGFIRKEAVVKNHFNYISLPLKLGYEIGDKIKGFAKIGMNTSLLLKAQTAFDVEETGDVELDLTDDIQTLDLSGIIELGAGFEFSEKMKLILLVGYNHSFTTYTCPSFFESKKLKHYSFNISTGIKYKLNKN